MAPDVTANVCGLRLGAFFTARPAPWMTVAEGSGSWSAMFCTYDLNSWSSLTSAIFLSLRACTAPLARSSAAACAARRSAMACAMTASVGEGVGKEGLFVTDFTTWSANERSAGTVLGRSRETRERTLVVVLLTESSLVGRLESRRRWKGKLRRLKEILCGCALDRRRLTKCNRRLATSQFRLDLVRRRLELVLRRLTKCSCRLEHDRRRQTKSVGGLEKCILRPTH